MKKGLRVIAMVTLVSFLTTQCVSGAPAAGIQITGGRELPGYLSIDVPAELGTVDALYEASGSANPQFILHIQNAHANYEAQIKIKQLLGYMNKKYGFKTIFVEGASAKLDADYLRLFPDAKSNNELCDALAKQGELTGAELFLMEQTADQRPETTDPRRATASRLKSQVSSLKSSGVEALGIEQAKLYRSNYDALKKVFGAETDVNRFFAGFDSKLDRVASTTFTPEARQLIADWKRFEQGRREFMPFVRSLAAKSKKIMKVDLESLFAQVGWPQISRLLVIQQLEKDLNKEKGLAEKAALIKMLRTKKVSKELLASLESFNEGSVSVGKSATEVSPRQVLERLASEAGPKGFKFSDYPAFSLFAGYVTLRSELDPKVLFEEIDYLFTQMLDTLAQDPQQKLLLTLYRDGELLRKLLHLQLNRAQWRQVLTNREQIAIPALVARLKSAVQTTDRRLATSDRLQSPVSSLQAVGDVMPKAFSAKMTEVFNAGLSFYDFAHQREAVFYKEMQDAMSQRKITKAILITGGFHTDGMSDMFRENAVSYGIVTPRLAEKSDENLYRSIMMHKNVGAFDVSYMDAVIAMEPAKNKVLQGGLEEVAADVTLVFRQFRTQLAAKGIVLDMDAAVEAFKKTKAGKKFLAPEADGKSVVIAKVGPEQYQLKSSEAKGFRPWGVAVEAEPSVERVARHLESVIANSAKLQKRFSSTVGTEGSVITLREVSGPKDYISFDLAPGRGQAQELVALAAALETDAAAITKILTARSEARPVMAPVPAEDLTADYVQKTFERPTEEQGLHPSAEVVKVVSAGNYVAVLYHIPKDLTNGMLSPWELVIYDRTEHRMAEWQKKPEPFYAFPTVTYFGDSDLLEVKKGTKGERDSRLYVADLQTGLPIVEDNNMEVLGNDGQFYVASTGINNTVFHSLNVKTREHTTVEFTGNTRYGHIVEGTPILHVFSNDISADAPHALYDVSLGLKAPPVFTWKGNRVWSYKNGEVAFDVHVDGEVPYKEIHNLTTGAVTKDYSRSEARLADPVDSFAEVMAATRKLRAEEQISSVDLAQTAARTVEWLIAEIDAGNVIPSNEDKNRALTALGDFEGSDVLKTQITDAMAQAAVQSVIARTGLLGQSFTVDDRSASPADIVRSYRAFLGEHPDAQLAMPDIKDIRAIRAIVESLVEKGMLVKLRHAKFLTTSKGKKAIVLAGLKRLIRSTFNAVDFEAGSGRLHDGFLTNEEFGPVSWINEQVPSYLTKISVIADLAALQNEFLSWLANSFYEKQSPELMLEELKKDTQFAKVYLRHLYAMRIVTLIDQRQLALSKKAPARSEFRVREGQAAVAVKGNIFSRFMASTRDLGMTSSELGEPSYFSASAWLFNLTILGILFAFHSAVIELPRKLFLFSFWQVPRWVFYAIQGKHVPKSKFPEQNLDLEPGLGLWEGTVLIGLVCAIPFVGFLKYSQRIEQQQRAVMAQVVNSRPIDLNTVLHTGDAVVYRVGGKKSKVIGVNAQEGKVVLADLDGQGNPKEGSAQTVTANSLLTELYIPVAAIATAVRSEARTGQEMAVELAPQSLVNSALKALFDLQQAQNRASAPALVAAERRVALSILAQAPNVAGLWTYLNDPKNAAAAQPDALKNDFVITLLSQANVAESLASEITVMLRRLIAQFEAIGAAGTAKDRISGARSEARSEKDLASMMLIRLRPKLDGYIKKFAGITELDRDQQEMIWAETELNSDPAAWMPLMGDDTGEDAVNAAALYSRLFAEFVEKNVKNRNAFEFFSEAVAKLEIMARSEQRDMREDVQTFLSENASISGKIRDISSLKSATDWRKLFIRSLTPYQARVVADWVADMQKLISGELKAAGKDPEPTLSLFVPLLNNKIGRLPNVSPEDKPSVFPGWLSKLLNRSESRPLNAVVDGNDLANPYPLASAIAVLDAVRALFEQNKLSQLSVAVNVTGTTEEMIYTERTGTKSLSAALAKKTSDARYSLQVLGSVISPRLQITLQRSESRQFEFKANDKIYMVGVGDKTIGAHTYNLPDGTPDVFLRLGDTQQLEGTLIAHYEVYRAENPDVSLGTVTVHYVHDPAYDAELRGYSAISLFSDPARTAIRITAKDDAKVLNLLNTWRMQPISLHGDVKVTARSESRAKWVSKLKAVGAGFREAGEVIVAIAYLGGYAALGMVLVPLSMLVHRLFPGFKAPAPRSLVGIKLVGLYLLVLVAPNAALAVGFLMGAASLGWLTFAGISIVGAMLAGGAVLLPYLASNNNVPQREAVTETALERLGEIAGQYPTELIRREEQDLADSRAILQQQVQEAAARSEARKELDKEEIQELSSALGLTADEFVVAMEKVSVGNHSKLFPLGRTEFSTEITETYGKALAEKLVKPSHLDAINSIVVKILNKVRDPKKKPIEKGLLIAAPTVASAVALIAGMGLAVPAARSEARTRSSFMTNVHDVVARVPFTGDANKFFSKTRAALAKASAFLPEKNRANVIVDPSDDSDQLLKESFPDRESEEDFRWIFQAERLPAPNDQIRLRQSQSGLYLGHQKSEKYAFRLNMKTQRPEFSRGGGAWMPIPGAVGVEARVLNTSFGFGPVYSGLSLHMVLTATDRQSRKQVEKFISRIDYLGNTEAIRIEAGLAKDTQPLKAEAIDIFRKEMPNLSPEDAEILANDLVEHFTGSVQDIERFAKAMAAIAASVSETENEQRGWNEFLYDLAGTLEKVLSDCWEGKHPFGFKDVLKHLEGLAQDPALLAAYAWLAVNMNEIETLGGKMDSVENLPDQILPDGRAKMAGFIANYNTLREVVLSAAEANKSNGAKAALKVAALKILANPGPDLSARKPAARSESRVERSFVRETLFDEIGIAVPALAGMPTERDTFETLGVGPDDIALVGSLLQMDFSALTPEGDNILQQLTSDPNRQFSLMIDDITAHLNRSEARKTTPATISELRDRIRAINGQITEQYNELGGLLPFFEGSRRVVQNEIARLELERTRLENELRQLRKPKAVNVSDEMITEAREAVARAQAKAGGASNLMEAGAAGFVAMGGQSEFFGRLHEVAKLDHGTANAQLETAQLRLKELLQQQKLYRQQHPAKTHRSEARVNYFLRNVNGTETWDEMNKKLTRWSINSVMKAVETGVKAYLAKEVQAGSFSQQVADESLATTLKGVRAWLSSEYLDQYTKRGILKAVGKERWKDINTAFGENVQFGTAGVRALAALGEEDLQEFNAKGFHSEHLKGTATVNNVTLGLVMTAVAQAYKQKGQYNTALTYDSRIYGAALADFMGAVYLNAGLNLYIFDETAPMPEMSFSVAHLKLDFGNLVSASHNPPDSNGGKVSNWLGAQLDPATRNRIVAIAFGTKDGKYPGVRFSDIATVLRASAELENPHAVYEIPADSEDMGPLVEMFSKGHPEKVTILESKNVKADSNGRRHIDIHNPHADYVVSHMLMERKKLKKIASKMRVVFSGFYGNGEAAMRRTLVDRVGVKEKNLQVVEDYRIHNLHGTNPLPAGFFPKFRYRTPDSIIPDPGNSAGNAFAWEEVLASLIIQNGGDVARALKGVDFIAGVDPDSDRFGTVVTMIAEALKEVYPEGLPEKLEAIAAKKKPPVGEVARVAQLIAYLVPQNMRKQVGFGGAALLTANDTWAVLNKYRIDRFAEMIEAGRIPKDTKFTIVKTHVTTDALNALVLYAASKGVSLEVKEPFVGFTLCALDMVNSWKELKINISANEESAGFSIGGGAPIIYTLLALFKKHEDYRIDIRNRAIFANHNEPVFALNEMSYDRYPESRGNLGKSFFGYTRTEIFEALQYLKKQGIVRQEGESWTLESGYKGLRDDAKAYWETFEMDRPEGEGDRLLPSIIEGAPGYRLGKHGHTQEKDGFLAMNLLFEVTAYAKDHGMTLYQYLKKEVYLNKLIGLFATINIALAYDPGTVGNAAKIKTLQASMDAALDVVRGGELIIRGKKVVRIELFFPKEGKYMKKTAASFPHSRYKDLMAVISDPELRNEAWLTANGYFPEEGVRFILEDGSHITPRPSGTEAKIRFYVQAFKRLSELVEKMQAEGRSDEEIDVAVDLAITETIKEAYQLAEAAQDLFQAIAFGVKLKQGEFAILPNGARMEVESVTARDIGKIDEESAQAVVKVTRGDKILFSRAVLMGGPAITDARLPGIEIRLRSVNTANPKAFIANLSISPARSESRVMTADEAMRIMKDDMPGMVLKDNGVFGYLGASKDLAGLSQAYWLGLILPERLADGKKPPKGAQDPRFSGYKDFFNSFDRKHSIRAVADVATPDQLEVLLVAAAAKFAANANIRYDAVKAAIQGETDYNEMRKKILTLARVELERQLAEAKRNEAEIKAAHRPESRTDTRDEEFDHKLNAAKKEIARLQALLEVPRSARSEMRDVNKLIEALTPLILQAAAAITADKTDRAIAERAHALNAAASHLQRISTDWRLLRDADPSKVGPIPMVDLDAEIAAPRGNPADSERIINGLVILNDSLRPAPRFALRLTAPVVALSLLLGSVTSAMAQLTIEIIRYVRTNNVSTLTFSMMPEGRVYVGNVVFKRGVALAGPFSVASGNLIPEEGVTLDNTGGFYTRSIPDAANATNGFIKVEADQVGITVPVTGTWSSDSGAAIGSSNGMTVVTYPKTADIPSNANAGAILMLDTPLSTLRYKALKITAIATVYDPNLDNSIQFLGASSRGMLTGALPKKVVSGANTFYVELASGTADLTSLRLAEYSTPGWASGVKTFAIESVEAIEALPTDVRSEARTLDELKGYATKAIVDANALVQDLVGKGYEGAKRLQVVDAWGAMRDQSLQGVPLAVDVAMLSGPVNAFRKKINNQFSNRPNAPESEKLAVDGALTILDDVSAILRSESRLPELPKGVVVSADDKTVRLGDKIFSEDAFFDAASEIDKDVRKQINQGKEDLVKVLAQEDTVNGPALVAIMTAATAALKDQGEEIKPVSWILSEIRYYSWRMTLTQSQALVAWLEQFEETVQDILHPMTQSEILARNIQGELKRLKALEPVKPVPSAQVAPQEMPSISGLLPNVAEKTITVARFFNYLALSFFAGAVVAVAAFVGFRLTTHPDNEIPALFAALHSAVTAVSIWTLMGIVQLVETGKAWYRKNFRENVKRAPGVSESKERRDAYEQIGIIGQTLAIATPEMKPGLLAQLEAAYARVKRSEARNVLSKEAVNQKLDQLRSVEAEIAKLELQIDEETHLLSPETWETIQVKKAERATLRNLLYNEEVPAAESVEADNINLLLPQYNEIKAEVDRLEKLSGAIKVHLQELKKILTESKKPSGDTERVRLTQEKARKTVQLSHIQLYLQYLRGLVERVEQYRAEHGEEQPTIAAGVRSEVVTVKPVVAKTPALEIETGESVVVKRQAFALEVWKLLTPEVRERLLNISPEFDVNSLAGILGYIIIPAGGKMTPEAVAAALLDLAKEGSGELVWSQFVERSKAFQSSAAAKELYNFSDRPGGVVSLITQAPSAEMVRDLLFQLGVKTGQVVALVVANDELANDPEAQKSIRADLDAQAQKSFDHKGKLINTQDGTPLGERIRIVFSRANLMAAKDALNNAGVDVGKAVKGTQNVVVLINELPELVGMVSVGTVLDGTGDEGHGRADYATIRHWISGQVSELVDASKTAAQVAEELVKQLNEVVVQVRGKNLWLDEKVLASLQALQSKLDEMRALSVAA